MLLAPHILLASNPNGTALGGPLGAIGAIGLVALALWAVLARWQSVVPEPLVRSARDGQELQTSLRAAGVPARRIHREHFDWR